MRFVMLAAVLLCAACPSEEAVRPTDEVRLWTFIEALGGEHPCGPILDFTGPLRHVCDRLEYQSDLEIGCGEAYVKWVSLETPQRGTLQLITETCDTTYTVIGTTP